mgnify:CR=1 FL=1
MDIVRNLKDFKLTHKQKVFAGFLKENISTYSCSEKITNKAYIRKYFSPENDFLIYSTAVADPAKLIKRKAI